ncbi:MULTISPECIES: acyltransferase family protein [Bradyrhizobium]|uniref:Peptidoglycan/LPS O-acetylase OafA/YrhL, contains acyltransferase and SGNH-hydrolase domains n=2 Tax=Bradyrhizobium TaxID=374 RepID=A0ABY0Q8U2_9BRAD|nr:MULTISPECIES: acyltransferase [Bradyrhizobium]SDJ71235.1 Peptidoglycan/LPS O-acetylase OafA/YrhL, contains acyltransferase and SGNH-hydrolase domains [Bradyrhizobium ottawaense]SEC22326.1 Peptidoglycan/LPS O-acetylase OafA/YrhL, contains acyltransferase and SGNH-hydrolase domains [Bradyrhizobium lablabi]
MTGRNRSLDGLRGVAVILTYLVHYCGSYMATFRGGNPNIVALKDWPELFDKVLYWLFRSHHGVHIFFMLSGFLISRIVMREDFQYLSFVGNRMKRIYPGFLLALITCIIAGIYLRIPVPGWRDIALNLVFLNGSPSSGVVGIVFNNVTWSLFYEMVFYLSFPLIVMGAAWARIPVLSAIVLAGVSVAYLPSLEGYYTEFFLFLFAGAIIGRLPRASIDMLAAQFPDLVVALLYGIIVALLTMAYISTGQFVWMFAGLGAIILCKAVSGHCALATALSFPPLAWLGTISYSFYLLHSVAIAFLFAGWWQFYIPRLGIVMNSVTMGGLGFVAAIAISWVSYLVAERPYFRNHKSVDLTADPSTGAPAMSSPAGSAMP